jgi:hypothetical protein
MTPSPREYRITEELLTEMHEESLNDYGESLIPDELWQKVRSRPIPASPSEQEIRADEREKVIEKLEARKNTLEVIYGSMSAEMQQMAKIRCEEIDGIIESLRHPTTAQEREG